MRDAVHSPRATLEADTLCCALGAPTKGSMGETHNTISGFLNEQMLVAMPGMLDPNFFQSVTLLCQHTEEGAIGITINRASQMTLGEVLEQLDLVCEDAETRDRPVLDGGPVRPDRGFVLHSPGTEYESSVEVAPGIMVTTSRDVLAAIAAGTGPAQYVVALGYAGWGEGQLEDEMRENAWLSVPVDRVIVFEAPLQNRWSEAVGRLGVNVSQLHQDGGHA